MGEAESGVLLLDEVNSMPMEVQGKVLRFLGEGTHNPVGAARAIRPDVRVLAATNADLKQLVSKGLFRQDLYYRLNQLRIALPPLRLRLEDISLLASHFLAESATSSAHVVKTLTPAALGRLKGHAWPGNVRELQTTIYNAAAATSGPIIDSSDIELDEQPVLALPATFHAAMRVAEREYFIRVLDRHRGNVSKAAAEAKLHRTSFYQHLRTHHISIADFRPG